MSITINLSDIVSKHRARLNQQQSKSPKKIKQQYSNTQQEALPILNTNDPLEKALHKWNKAIIWRDGMRDEFAKRAARAYRTS